MMPGFINNTLEQQRRVQRLVRETVVQFFKDNPLPAGPKGADGKDGQSIVGPMGPPGKDGSDGKSITGPAGPQGPAGRDGQSITGPQGPAASTLVGTVTIAETAILNANLQVRRVTVPLAGAVTTGIYIAVPVSTPPTGYSIQEVTCSTDGRVTVGVLVPVLQLLTTYSIPVRILRLTT